MKLNNLEKHFNEEEDRFEELKRYFGQIKSQGLYTSVDGFDRSLLHMLLKLIMPVVLALLLVFIDTAWILIILVPGLFHVYFNLQL
jgi:hypothetical protein